MRTICHRLGCCRSEPPGPPSHVPCGGRLQVRSLARSLALWRRDGAETDALRRVRRWDAATAAEDSERNN